MRENTIFETTNIVVAVLTGTMLIFIPKIFGAILISVSLGYQFYSTQQHFKENQPAKEHFFFFVFLLCAASSFFINSPYRLLIAYFAFSSLIRYALGLYFFAEKEEDRKKFLYFQNIISQQEKDIEKLSSSISEEEILQRISEVKTFFEQEEKEKITLLAHEYEKKMRLKENTVTNLEAEYKKHLQNLQQQHANAISEYEKELRQKNDELIRIETVVSKQKEKIQQQEKQIEELHRQQDNFIEAQEKASSHENIVIFNADIYKALKTAISETKKELDIMSPWVSESVVDNEIRLLMRDLVNRGAIIKIVYGIKKDDHRLGNTENTIESIKSFCGKNAKNILVKYYESHSKLIICDDKYYIITSCNPLSHKGNQWNEIGEKSVNIDNLKKYRKRYFNF